MNHAGGCPHDKLPSSAPRGCTMGLISKCALDRNGPLQTRRYPLLWECLHRTATSQVAEREECRSQGTSQASLRECLATDENGTRLSTFPNLTDCRCPWPTRTRSLHCHAEGPPLSFGGCLISLWRSSRLGVEHGVVRACRWIRPRVEEACQEGPSEGFFSFISHLSRRMDDERCRFASST